MDDSNMNNSGFIVSERRRKVWDLELYMLDQIINLCNEHNLSYFASGGTLLGAVRHQGYIPWDDDIDICMPRNDYDRLIDIAKTNLTPDLFLQTPETDKDYFFGHAKIRLNGTTAMKKTEILEDYEYHQGVFIDVFPMDSVPDKKFEYKLHKFISLKMYMVIYYSKYYYKSVSHSRVEDIKHKICSFFYPNNKSLFKLYKKYIKWIQKYNNKGTKRFGLISNFYNYDDKDVWEKSLFKEKMIVTFDKMNICIPKEYDKILTITYGDYMKPVKGGSIHGDIFFDFDNDYSMYKKGKLSVCKDGFIL